MNGEGTATHGMKNNEAQNYSIDKGELKYGDSNVCDTMWEKIYKSNV